MKVRKSSWHYKVWRWSNGKEEPTNLCAYFWHVAFVLLICASPLGWIAFLLAAIGAAGEWLQDKWDARSYRRGPRPPKVPREPGLIRSYLRAKKARVCPLIEFVDEDAR